MKSIVQNAAAGFARKHKNHTRYLALLACLSLAVGVGTWGGLRLTGQAQNHEQKVLACALELHTHIQSCYDEDGGLLCGQSDFAAHRHNLDCYDGSGVLVCQLAEHIEHRHEDGCYSTDQTLVCGKSEKEAHTHGDGCYTETETPACTAAEHTHTDECYAATPEAAQAAPLCGQAEHTHGEACRTADRPLACGQEEIAADDPAVHRHGDGCYETVKTLLCDQEECIPHEHTEECYTPVAEFDQMTDEQRAELCGRGVDPEHLLTAENAEGQPVYITCGQTALLAHTHADGCFKTVVLSGDEVEALAPEQPEQPPEGDGAFVVEPGGLTTREVENDTLKITAAYGPEAAIPADALLRAEVVGSEDAQYSRRAEQTREVLGLTDEESCEASMTLLNIGFYRIGADGQEIEVEPQATVTVTLQMKENGFAVGDPVTVVHFPEDADSERQNPEVLDTADVTDEGAATFETDSFSDFMVVYGLPAAPAAAVAAPATGSDGTKVSFKNVAAGTDTPLSGGTFTLSNAEGAAVSTVLAAADGSFHSLTGGADGTLQEGETGVFTLPAGAYTLTQQTAAEGYQPLDTTLNFRVDAASGVTAEGEYGDAFEIGQPVADGSMLPLMTDLKGYEDANGSLDGLQVAILPTKTSGDGYALNAQTNHTGSPGTVVENGDGTFFKLNWGTNLNHEDGYILWQFELDATRTDKGYKWYYLKCVNTDNTYLQAGAAVQTPVQGKTRATPFAIQVDEANDAAKFFYKDPDRNNYYALTVNGGNSFTANPANSIDSAMPLYLYRYGLGGMPMVATYALTVRNEARAATGGGTGSSTGGSTDTYSTNVSFTKYDEDGTTPLEGAAFTLSGNGVSYTLTSAADGKLAAADGTTSFSLAPGSYTLTETAAPAGYEKMPDAYTFTVDATGNIGLNDYGDGLVKVEKTGSTTEEIPGGTTGGGTTSGGSTTTGSSVSIEDSILRNPDPENNTLLTWEQYRSQTFGTKLTAQDFANLGGVPNGISGLVGSGNATPTPGMRFDVVDAQENGNNVTLTWRFVVGPYPQGDGWMIPDDLVKNSFEFYFTKNLTYVPNSFTWDSYKVVGISAPVAITKSKTMNASPRFTTMGNWSSYKFETGSLNSISDSGVNCLVATFKTNISANDATTANVGMLCKMQGNLNCGTFGQGQGQLFTQAGSFSGDIQDPTSGKHTTQNFAVGVKNNKTVTAKLALRKVDENGATLADAGFKLYREADVTVGTTADGSTTVEPKGDATNPPLWVGTSLADGTVPGQDNTPFPDLPDGTYYLLEHTPPAGFATPAAIKIVVANGVVKATQGTQTLLNDVDAATAAQTITITNKRSTVAVDFVKVSTNNVNEKLAGATFDLYKKLPGEAAGAEHVTAVLPEGYYQKVKSDMTSVAGTGLFGSENLQIGAEYYLVEKQAPAGYLPLTGPVKITVNAGSVAAEYGGAVVDWAEAKTQSSGYTVSVHNSTGQRLPETGGAGTQWYTMSGLVLVGCALLYIALKGRRGRRS